MPHIFLIFISILSFGGIGYLIWRKIPFLLAVPENIIYESFITKPSKLKVFLKKWKEYFVERKFEPPILAFSELFFRKLRIIFLRLEYLSSRSLKYVQERKRFLKIPKKHRDYLKSMKDEQNGSGGKP